jgi:ATP-dependent Lhr-like helicase
MARYSFTAARLSRINSLIESHTSSLIFVNSRTLAEMLGEKLSRLRKDVGVHHGSLPRDERERVEQAFRAGSLKALVCTSTLELGIDIGSVDLVLQYMSPRQVTSLIQRVGRSGHDLRRTYEGVIIAVSADDILESAASIEEARAGRLEETRPYENSLDVLAHQVAGYLMDYDSMEKGAILTEVKKAYPFRDLSEEAFQRVVDYLAQIRKLRVDGTRLSRNRASTSELPKPITRPIDATRSPFRRISRSTSRE